MREVPSNMDYIGDNDGVHLWEYATQEADIEKRSTQTCVEMDTYKMILAKMEPEIRAIPKPIQVIDLGYIEFVGSYILNTPPLHEGGTTFPEVQQVWDEFTWQGNPRLPIIVLNRHVNYAALFVHNLNHNDTETK